ncbi:nicotinamide phosphoribosyltransferase-like [Panulirus ornatus]|uniref:nicotinamide phosphoribosyltransferase-like n=1 Tax=Panulirus ornatus TaxID=150431 RepID=UPI003A867D8F
MDIGPVNNVILLADCYKVTHYDQYPPGTTVIYSYFESRGGKFPYTCFFGLQYIIKRWLAGPVVTREAIQEAKEIYSGIYAEEGVFNEEGWNHILEHHGGRLPLRIKAVPEGTILPTRNVLFTVENTDPAVPWITNFFETVLVQTWYPTTVATSSRIHKQVLHHYASLSHTNLHAVDYSLHDCGYRGVSSVETAAIGGAANMISFKTSDTVAGTCLLRKYYNLKTVGGQSGPFSEHSTVTSWGRQREADAHKHLITNNLGRRVGCVVDSYNVWECCHDIFGVQLKDLVLEHGRKGGFLALRPDSGNPTEVVLKCLEILGQQFGTETNSKGYRTLPPYLMVCQADGVNYRSLASILETITSHGWSAASVGFGAGASLLQRMDRDTMKFAYKCSFAVVDGEEVEVYKEPITDSGKTSKRGRLSLQRENGVYTTIQHGQGDPEKDLLVPVFENGKLLVDYTFEEIRQRAELTENDIDILKFLAEEK